MKLFGIKKERNHIKLNIFGIKINIKTKTYLTEADVCKMLNSIMDIRNCPKAHGKLRKLQTADTLVLKMFHNICQKYNIKYFLNFGTLLGAIRHNGFIPWDDDLDVTILYEDYNKLVSVLSDELKNTDFEIYGVEKSRLGDANLRISHKMIPEINLDIFYMHPSSLTMNDINYIKEQQKHYKKIYFEKYKKMRNKENKEMLANLRKNVIEPYHKAIKGCNLSDSNIIISRADGFFFVIQKEDLLPLVTHKFEDFEFYIPNNSDKILSLVYKNYMEFPHSIEHHGDVFKDFDEKIIDEVIEKIKSCINN